MSDLTWKKGRAWCVDDLMDNLSYSNVGVEWSASRSCQPQRPDLLRWLEYQNMPRVNGERSCGVRICVAWQHWMGDSANLLDRMYLAGGRLSGLTCLSGEIRRTADLVSDLISHLVSSMRTSYGPESPCCDRIKWTTVPRVMRVLTFSGLLQDREKGAM